MAPSLGALAVCLLCASCATGPEPREELAAGRAAVEQAAAAGAKDLAPSEFAAANDKLNRAQAVAAQDPVTARRLAEEAQVDARLAIVTAESRRTQQASEELDQSIRALKEEGATPARR
ncbi:MAG TPA: DUF4398 domain-containing protein [Burkholderiaceae bacterium]|nr:DUF4398 domain-containing protein [Burkholderiaceae bacterium]